MKTLTHINLFRYLNQVFFIVKISLSSIFFIIRSSVALLIETSKKSRVLICIYLLLLAQALLVFFSEQPPIAESAQANKELPLLIEQHIDPLFLEKKQISEPTSNQEVLQNEGLIMIPQTRDGLINAAINSLDNNDEDDFLELIKKAKELDPNWEGWLK